MSFNTRIVEEAEEVVRQVVESFVDSVGSEQATAANAPAGAGKSELVTRAAGAARQRGARIAVAAPTNEQVYALVRRIAMRYPRQTVCFVPAHGRVLPFVLPNVRVCSSMQANGESLIVGTLDKLGDAFSRGDLHQFDLLAIDEAYQADSARYYAVGGLASGHLVVGDPGQLSPFSTIEHPDRWRGLPEDPLQTAAGVLLRNHPHTPLYRLPVTRRLDPRSVPIAQAFYPGHHFEAAVLPGTRQFRLLPSAAADRLTHALDQALDTAANEAWAHLELPEAAVLTADPVTVQVISRLLVRLFERHPRLRCELHTDWRELDPAAIAVGVSHNDQKDLVRMALDEVSLQAVQVETANKLQGLEFELLVAWHPLAGLPDPDGFHLDPGRLAVLLTRHRHACIVVGRRGDRDLVSLVPPATPAYLGWDPDPLLDGWSVHERIFELLDPYRVEIPAIAVDL